MCNNVYDNVIMIQILKFNIMFSTNIKIDTFYIKGFNIAKLIF